MRTIRKGVVMPTDSEIPNLFKYAKLERVDKWIHPLVYGLKLVFFVLFVLPPAALFWFAFIAAKGDVNYLIAEVSVMLHSTNAAELTSAFTSAYCVSALFAVLFVGLYVLMFPYRRPGSYVVSDRKEALENELSTPKSAGELQ